MIQKRLFYVLRVAILLLLSGSGYAVFFHFTGVGLVCPVHLVTGWKCPGCGVTHMCMALLHLDFTAAYMANPALLLLSPLLAVIFAQYVLTYIRTGRWHMCLWQNIALWGCIVILFIYGIGRNIFSLP